MIDLGELERRARSNALHAIPVKTESLRTLISALRDAVGALQTTCDCGDDGTVGRICAARGRIAKAVKL